jgi:hypothetical protein
MDMSMADRRGTVYKLWCSVERELRGWKGQFIAEALLLGRLLAFALLCALIF